MRWLLVVLAGCWSNTTTPPAQPQPIEVTGGTWHPSRTVDRCATVVPHIYENVRSDPSSSRFPAGMLDDLQSATLDHCRETAWSDEAIDCYEKSTNLNDTTSCYRLMTDQQRDSFQDKFKDIMQRYQGALYGNPTP